MSDEFAQLGRASSFPIEWGAPLGRSDSDERARWVREMVRRHPALTAHQRLADRDLRLLTALRSVELDRRRECP